LKPTCGGAHPGGPYVAPHAGAWIETTYYATLDPLRVRRPPRGGVD